MIIIFLRKKWDPLRLTRHGGLVTCGLSELQGALSTQGDKLEPA